MTKCVNCSQDLKIHAVYGPLGPVCNRCHQGKHLRWFFYIKCITWQCINYHV